MGTVDAHTLDNGYRTFPVGADAVAAEWDGRVDSWADVCGGPAFLRFRDRAIAAARPSLDDDVVDVGCGTGLLALEFASRARRVWALDISPGMIEAVAANASAASLHNLVAMRADARSLPLADASVDLVVSCYTLHHLDHPGKLRALREARRVLRPGGRLVVVDMMFEVSLARTDRSIVMRKAFQLLRKGPAGVVRLARNALRLAWGRWEQPAGLGWWKGAAQTLVFDGVSVVRLEQEAGMLIATKPG